MTKKLVYIFIVLAALTFIICINHYKHIEISNSQSLGTHVGTNQTTDFFDSAYVNSDIKTSDKIAGIIVNHHLLAPNLIAKQFSLIATDKPVTVLLISPNHFMRGQGGVITSRFDWVTPFGVLNTDQNIVTKLQQTGLVNVDETPFEQEHGINGIVGFIKKSLPNATFVPLIIKDNFRDADVDQLAGRLKDILPNDSIVVGSLDFSHYLPSNAAEFHDRQTLAVINNFDYDRIDKLDIDSHPGMRLLLKYFDLEGDKKFVLTSHENSSTVTGNYNLLETTSYINGYFTSGSNKRDNTQTALYIKGVGQHDIWDPESSIRLYEYNDELLSSEPKGTPVKIGAGPIAVGFVYNPNLTDVYLFPLTIKNQIIELLPQSNSDIMHIHF